VRVAVVCAVIVGSVRVVMSRDQMLRREKILDSEDERMNVCFEFERLQ
jgi:hypothetical protein